MNGVGGNLVAVQASRLSTHLHCSTGGRGPGALPAGEHASCCLPPSATLCGADSHGATARILLLLVLPGHLIFAFTISMLDAGHTPPSLLFTTVYMGAALIQVCLLLHVCRVLVPCLWARGIDPDSAAIPYLTALGDLLGGALLAATFVLLSLAGQEEGTHVGDAMAANLSTIAANASMAATTSPSPALLTTLQDLNQAAGAR